MTKKDSGKQNRKGELDLQKKTLKDLPESGEDQMGGGFQLPTVPTTPVLPLPGTKPISTGICTKR